MCLYKIVSIDQWQQSQSKENLVLPALDAHFIHLAQEDQKENVITKFWSHIPHVILKLDSAQLPGELKLESNRPGGEEYYHLYNGSIPMSAIIEVIKSSSATMPHASI